VAGGCLVSLICLLLTALPAWAVSIDYQAFGQLDWYDPSGSVVAGDSSWGRMDYNVTCDPNADYFINVVANAGSGPAWIVQNLPVFASSYGGFSELSVFFDIVDLGIPAGTSLDSMGVLTTLDSSPLSSAPTGSLTSFGVSNLVQQAGGGLLDLPVSDPGQPAGHKAGGIPTDVIKHDNVPGVQEEDSMCLAGALARSIVWLKPDPNKPAQSVYDDLKNLKVGAPYYDPNTNTYADMIRKKADYLKGRDPNAVTKILDVGNSMPPIPGVTEVPPQDVVDFLKQEMKTEDIELDYGPHIITVTDMYKQGGKVFISYRDDEDQGDPNKGDSREKEGQLTMKNGKYYFNRDPNAPVGSGWDVRLIISESIPEPATVSLLALGGLCLIRRWRKQA